MSNWMKVVVAVASAGPSRPPFGNVNERGTFPGTEEVVVSLVSDVAAAPPDTVLQVRNVLID